MENCDTILCPLLISPTSPCMRYSTYPLFQGFKIFTENVRVSFMKKAEVRMSQAWAVGFTTLELSKYVMRSSSSNHGQSKLDEHCVGLSVDTSRKRVL